jgi:glutamine synthetase
VVSLLEAHKVLTKEESESRYHIYLEKYAKQVNIEAGVTIDMSRRGVFPAASSYAADIARDAASLAAIHAPSAAQEKRAKRISELTGELYEETAKLDAVLAEAQKTEDPFAQAKAYFEKVRPAMDGVRAKADAIEKLVDKQRWPYPGYQDMLFKL